MAQSAKIQSMSGAHDAILDIMLANPFLTLKELARRTGYTVSWISTIKRSDCFVARYNERRGDIECGVMKDIQERLQDLALVAVDKMEELLVEKNLDADETTDAFDKVMKAAGYAPNSKNSPAVLNQQNNFYVSQSDLQEMRGNIINGSVSPAGELSPPDSPAE